MIDVSITDEVTSYLNEITEAANSLPKDEIGDVAINDIHSLFDAEGGGSWDPPLVPQDHPLLFKTGALYDALSARDSFEGVLVFNDLPYASYQNDMRPFMLLSNEAEAEIEEILVKHLIPD